MTSPRFVLAQVNIARMIAPREDPRMSGFFARVAEINALAEKSPGFIWRFKDDEGDATYIRPYDDDSILFNMSVWESPTALESYVFKTNHAEVLRARKQWFEKHEGAATALWWIPASRTPSIEEAKARLAHIDAFGPTASAFTFRDSFAPPASAAIDYDGRTFAGLRVSETGDAGPGTTFLYRQREDAVWGTYEGGNVKMGTLVATATTDGVLDMRYQHIDREGALKTGVCQSIPHPLEDGRMRLFEMWQWTSGERARGSSVIEEIRTDPGRGAT